MYLVLLAGIVLFLHSERTRPSRESAAARGAGSPAGWWLLGVLLLVAVLVALGRGQLAVIGGVVLALLRGLSSLLRIWSPLRYWSQSASSFGAGATGKSGPGSRDSDWRDPGPARPARMSRSEALEVLGLDERATRDDVQREYRRLIKRLQPDLGGSTYLTAKLNEARDVLS